MLNALTKIVTVYDGNIHLIDLIAKPNTLVYYWNPTTKLPEIKELIVEPGNSYDGWDVTFDSGLVVRCTEDHNFHAFRGEKIPANQLRIGQSIRAFSISLAKDGHYRVHGWVNGKARHQYVARMIWEYFNGPIQDKLILHHKDFNKLNNRLDNLEVLTNSYHNAVHYPYRVDGGFFRRKNHKVVSVEKSNYCLGCALLNIPNVIIADDVPTAGITTGIVSCSE